MRKAILFAPLVVTLTFGSLGFASCKAEKGNLDVEDQADRGNISIRQETAGNTVPSKVRIRSFFNELMRLSPRPVGSETLQNCRTYLIETLKDFSLVVWEEAFTADTPRGPMPMANVVAEHKGSGEGIICLGSHIDTKSIDGIEFLGANDSGASTAALLELARIISEKKTERTYRFVFFDGEESIEKGMTPQDGLYGSKYHVLNLRQEERISEVRAMILLDMMGDRDLAINRDYNSSQKLWGFFAVCCQKLGYGDISRGSATYMYDDHVPFLEAGIPSLDIIDFSYGPDNSFWHTEKDTADKVSMDSIYKVIRVVLCVLDSLET